MRLKYIVIFIVIAALLLFTGCDRDKPEETAGVSATPVAESTEAKTQGDEVTLEGTGYGVGDVIYDFAVPLVGGDTFKLSDNLGKPLFINLFATWCPPCIAEMPDIQKLYDEYGSEAAFIVIDVGEDEATAQGFADDNGYTMPFAYSISGEVLPGYNIEFIPQTFVVGVDGTIVAYFPQAKSYADFKAALDKAIEAAQ